MDEIIDLIATDSKASDVSDKIKDILFTKASERVEKLREPVANVMFNEPEVEETEE